MIENVAQRVPEEFAHEVCFEDYIFERMSRRLADRVLNKILEGECVCKFVEKSITEERCTDQVEYRMGVDIRPLVRCKDCTAGIPSAGGWGGFAWPAPRPPT